MTPHKPKSHHKQGGGKRPKQSQSAKKSYSLSALAVETGRDRHTLRKIVRKLDPVRHVKGAPQWALEEVEAALEANPGTSKELLEERIISERLDNERKRREEAEARRELVRMDEVLVLMNNILLPVKQRLDSLPSEACSAANPTDPKHAFAALTEWSDQAKRLITEKMPQVKVGEPDQEVKV